MLDDLRSGIRQIRRNPGFACAVVVTLALGIGAPTAVFTLVDPMLFRPLPYPEADRLVRVSASGGGLRMPDYVAAREQHGGFEQLVLPFASMPVRLTGAEGSVWAASVERGFFETLRIDPAVGRRFLESEYLASQTQNVPEAALITWGFWQRFFGGRPDVLDEAIELSGTASGRVRIVGVLPRHFVYPDYRNDFPVIFFPYAVDATAPSASRSILELLARLKPGVSLEAAAVEMQSVVASVEREHGELPQGRDVRIVALQDALFGPVRMPVLLLLVATLCLLMLACANLAHLFMARLHARRGELDVRLALGGAPSRLVRQVLAESAILWVAGGVAAIAAAQATFAAIMAYTPQLARVYHLLPARVDTRVGAFAAVLVLGAVFVCVLLPGLAASRSRVRMILGSGDAVASSRVTRRVQRSLIGAQAATAVTVLVTSALIAGSFVRLAYQPLGWNAHDLRSITIMLPDGGPVAGPLAHGAVHEHLAERWPYRVTMMDGIPVWTLPGSATAAEADPSTMPPRVPAYRTTETVFDVLGLRLVRGRTFDARDVQLAAAVAVIDEHAAEWLWPGDDPIGREVLHSDGTSRTVIGVVAALRTRLAGGQEPGTVLLPFDAGYTGVRNLLTTDAAARLPLDEIQRIVQDVEPGASVRIAPLLMFERELGQPRFLAVLLGALGTLTAVLAIVGVFGVVSHQTAQRRREVGIRLALGAQRGRIRRMIVGDALLPAAAGVAAGAVASLWWTQSLRGLLYEVEPNDPATFTAAAGLVLAIVAAASLLPAVSASRTDPMTTLRME